MITDTNNISILILTLNEEQNLPSCLSSLDWCDDIVVLDSYSIDNTTVIAEKAGVRVFKRKFDNYACQRNYGMENINYKHKWVLMLDADEVVPVRLSREMNNAVYHSADDVTLFRVRRKDFLLGKWIKYSSKYPIWFGRLVKIGHAHVEREINEEYHTEGSIVSLKEHLIHYPFNKGFHSWLEKHNKYSTMEAELKYNQGIVGVSFKNLFSNDPVIRRKSIKALFHKLPGRPLWMFLLLYVFRGGFLEGRAGLTYCLLTSFYEYMIDCKVHELKIREEGKRL